MIEASEYIKQISSSIDNSLIGLFSGGKTFVNDTKWARKGKVVLDASNRPFKLIEVVTDEYVVADPIGHTNYLNGVFYIDKPFFITGTKLATNREWTLASNDLKDKTPIIWLLEIISETGYGKGSSVERDIDTKLFFLDETDPAQYYTKDHREQVVKPMQKLMSSFLNVVSNDRMYKPIENYRYKTFSRFGVETDAGVTENILDANLSGVALEISLTRYKEKYCKI